MTLVNQNKLILILDRRTEQVLLTVRIYLFDLFKKKGFNTDNIYILDGNQVIIGMMADLQE